MSNKKYYIVLDTETCNAIMEGDKLNLNYSLVYDIGWSIIDKKGNVYAERSFVVREIFFGEAELMKSAYYAEKIPGYLKEIGNGSRLVRSFYEVRTALIADMEQYNCKVVAAHNARFDLNALNVTERWLTKSKYRFFFPYETEIWDTLKMATDTIGKQKTYINFCEREGYMTKHKKPRPRMTAEVLYRYISGDNEFIEHHTGLEDTQIERQIFVHCMRQHKKMRKKLFED